MRRAAGVTLLATAATLLAAVPASAAPAVEGSLSSNATFPFSGNCTVAESPAPQTEPFTNRTGTRSATGGGSFEAVASGTTDVAVNANGSATTTGSVGTTGRTLRRATLGARHVVSLTNTDAYDCAATLTLDSQIGMSFEVADRPRRLTLAWDRTGGAGRIAQLTLYGAKGRTVADLAATKPSGRRTLRVRPGDYYLYVQYLTTISEADVAVGETGQARTRYRLDVTTAAVR